MEGKLKRGRAATCEIALLVCGSGIVDHSRVFNNGPEEGCRAGGVAMIHCDRETGQLLQF